MEKENKKKDKKILNQRNELHISKSIDELEQYSCRNCLLLHEIKEESKEDKDNAVIKSLPENFDIQLDKEDLDRTYCIGKPNWWQAPPYHDKICPL